jgi:glutamyl-tRNA reductase
MGVIPVTSLAPELLVAELRQRGEDAAAQVLLRNEAPLAKLTPDDRRRVETLLRTVVAQLLEEPESHLRQLSNETMSPRHLQAVCALFGLLHGAQGVGR